MFFKKGPVATLMPSKSPVNCTESILRSLNYTISVLSKLILSPERVPKLLNLSIACLKDSTSDKNRVVSSAN